MLYFKAKSIILQELNMTNEFEYVPDDLRTAHKKLLREEPNSVAILEEITKPIDKLVTKALFLDPFLKKMQAVSKTLTERSKFKKKKEA
jgi:hypothetical protein